MRIKYLDVLKAFAIIAVVLYHTGLMTYGYLGVDLFLVIAGFLTTRSLYAKIIVPRIVSDDQMTRDGKASYIDFEISRIIRLLPPLLVSGVFCMMLGYFVMLPDDYENLSESVVATDGFFNNILAAITTKNYWDISNEYKPLMHTWYVGVVMQFYIVYPILFYLSLLNKRNTKRALLTMIGTLTVVSLLIYFGISSDAERFYYLPSRFFEFAVGGIVALIYSSKEDKPFGNGFVYICYVLLLFLMAFNVEIMPSTIRLVVVVALSCVLISSQAVLENNITGCNVLAKIGAASYSIFVWHQVLLAFCRYTWTNDFTFGVYAVLLVATIILSWLSYELIEQGINTGLKTRKGRIWIYVTTAIVFIILTSYAGFIYRKGGVVRDVPELYISKNENVNHKAYNDKIYQLDKQFETNKLHWLVIGNSFGRDFANVVLESPIADSIEISYIHIDNDFKKPQYAERFASADRVWLSTLGVNEKIVTELEVVCAANGVPADRIVIVGEKNFGESNGQFYIHRNSPAYFNQRTKVGKNFVEKNNRLKALYGERYLDLISLVIDKDGTVPVFTPDHHFISQDCEHFSKGGTLWFTQMIDWNSYLN